jgi:hypothetical protein
MRPSEIIWYVRVQSSSERLAISTQPSWAWPVRARLQHSQDAPDQVLAVAAARLVAAYLLVPPPQLACDRPTGVRGPETHGRTIKTKTPDEMWAIDMWAIDAIGCLTDEGNA